MEHDLAALAQHCLSVSRMRPESWCVVGNCFSLNRECESAIKYFQRAVQCDSTFAYACVAPFPQCIFVTSRAGTRWPATSTTKTTTLNAPCSLSAPRSSATRAIIRRGTASAWCSRSRSDCPAQSAPRRRKQRRLQVTVSLWQVSLPPRARNQPPQLRPRRAAGHHPFGEGKGRQFGRGTRAAGKVTFDRGGVRGFRF